METDLLERLGEGVFTRHGGQSSKFRGWRSATENRAKIAILGYEDVKLPSKKKVLVLGGIHSFLWLLIESLLPAESLLSCTSVQNILMGRSCSFTLPNPPLCDPLLRGSCLRAVLGIGSVETGGISALYLLISPDS